MTTTQARPAPPPGSRAAQRSQRARRRRRRIALLVVLGVLALPIVLGAGWVWWQLDPPGGPGAAVTIDVEPGWGVTEIADALADADVVGSSFAFQVYVRASGSGPFLAGRYELRRDLGARPAAGALEAGPVVEYEELALPPGLTFMEIAGRVGALPGRSAERFLEVAASGTVRSRYQPPAVTSLEGLTYPDTYFVTSDEDETAILRRLVARFDEVGDAVGLADAPTTTGRSAYETVVVASLIQTEVVLDDERPVVAAVVDNRLAAGMQLQIDSTLIYARGTRDGPVTNADKLVASPYNTYAVTGLPPTPISTVTDVSLAAALAPADVAFLFYVLNDESGRHAFSETYEQHLEYVAEAEAKGLL